MLELQYYEPYSFFTLSGSRCFSQMFQIVNHLGESQFVARTLWGLAALAANDAIAVERGALHPLEPGQDLATAAWALGVFEVPHAVFFRRCEALVPVSSLSALDLANLVWAHGYLHMRSAAVPRAVATLDGVALDEQAAANVAWGLVQLKALPDRLLLELVRRPCTMPRGLESVILANALWLWCPRGSRRDAHTSWVFERLQGVLFRMNTISKKIGARCKYRSTR